MFPVEIWERILNEIDIVEVQRLRVVCRTWREIIERFKVFYYYKLQNYLLISLSTSICDKQSNTFCSTRQQNGQKSASTTSQRMNGIP